MRAFVTGIGGFLGSHLADALIVDGWNVSGNDNLVGADPENLKHFTGNLNVGEIWTGDSVDCCRQDAMAALFQKLRPDVLYHCAALAHEGLSTFSPSLISDSILGASASVFSAAIAAGVKRIVFMSSMARYGEGIVGWQNVQGSGYDCRSKPFKEFMSPRPIDPYGICKVAAEDLLRFLCKTHGVEYVIAVPHNIYGPRQRYTDPYRNVAAIMVNRMLQGKPPIIYGDGNQRRCFSYISDVVPSLVKMATQRNVKGEVINVGPDEAPVQIWELADMLAEITGTGKDYIHVADRPAEVKYATCSSNKARRLLGYKTTTSLHDGLVKLVDFIRERGPKPFSYSLPIEIQNGLTPKTWSERLM